MVDLGLEFEAAAAHVAWQSEFDSAPDAAIPFRVQVVIFHTVEQLREATGREGAYGVSMTWAEASADEVGACILLAKPHLELSILAHEVAHAALFAHGHRVGRGGAKRWLSEHPESVVDMIGNLTAVVWYGMPTEEDIDG